MEKTVLITGAATGIGRATAKKFASNGWNVVIHYFNSEEDAKELSRELLNKYNIKTYLYKADIREEKEVIDMVSDIEENFDHITSLINNAAISFDCSIEDKTVTNFKKIIDTNIIGPFLMSKYVGKRMFNRSNCSIINIASTNGIDTYYVESMDYDATKAALISLTHNLSLQYAPNVRVNCVAPGWVATDFVSNNIDDYYKRQEEDKIFSKRFAKPEEIANVIYFLASEEASYINNEVIRVDGGTYHA